MDKQAALETFSWQAFGAPIIKIYYFARDKSLSQRSIHLWAFSKLRAWLAKKITNSPQLTATFAAWTCCMRTLRNS